MSSLLSNFQKTIDHSTTNKRLIVCSNSRLHAKGLTGKSAMPSNTPTTLIEIDNDEADDVMTEEQELANMEGMDIVTCRQVLANLKANFMARKSSSHEKPIDELSSYQEESEHGSRTTEDEDFQYEEDPISEDVSLGPKDGDFKNHGNDLQPKTTDLSVSMEVESGIESRMIVVDPTLVLLKDFIGGVEFKFISNLALNHTLLDGAGNAAMLDMGKTPYLGEGHHGGDDNGDDGTSNSVLSSSDIAALDTIHSCWSAFA
ncbi:hypothetical protein Syun_025776 [Stephania yunnanensis]|uniref:Uncharacterized protein n=1 Tax=Stephania yunnanensis TaxID=152371 RepID=A0AAP0HW28_9MAGN